MVSSPRTIGSVCSPDSVADDPLTYCREVGRNVIDPSIAKPTMNASTTHTSKTDEVNSRSGSTGSTARCSTNTKTASDTSEPTNIKTMVDEVHGYSTPPHDSASVSPAAPRDTNTMPR